jgi:hypothetical protein
LVSRTFANLESYRGGSNGYSNSNSNVNGFSGGGSGYGSGGGYGNSFGGGGDRMSNLGANLKEQDWGKISFDLFVAELSLTKL